MRRVTVLLTCVGGRFMFDTIRALRRSEGLETRIVGVDARLGDSKRRPVDAFHRVPRAAEDPEGFVAAVLRICRDERVDAVIPGADEEVLALADTSSRFEALGVRTATQSREKLDLLQDKARLLKAVRQLGLPVPPFAVVSSGRDLLEFAATTTYPTAKLLLKPLIGRGARGLVLVDPDESGLRDSTIGRGVKTGSLDAVVESWESESMGRMLATEYFPGPAYDVDCVAKNGQPLCIVPRLRRWEDPFSPVSQGCQLVKAPQLEEFVEHITAGLGLDYALDFDIGTSAAGTPGLFEVNPRLSGAAAAGLVGGVNIPSILLRRLLGLPVDSVEYEEGVAVEPVATDSGVRFKRTTTEPTGVSTE